MPRGPAPWTDCAADQASLSHSDSVRWTSQEPITSAKTLFSDKAPSRASGWTCNCGGCCPTQERDRGSPLPPIQAPFPKTTPVLNLKGCFSPLSGVPHRKERMSNETLCPRGHQALYGDICGSCDSGSSGHREDGGGRDAAQPPSVPVAAPQGRGKRPWCAIWVSVSAHTGWSSREPGGHSRRAGRWLRSAARWLFPAALKQALLPSAFHSPRHDADRCGRSRGVSEKGQGRGHTPCLLCFSDTCGQLSTLPRLNVLSF